MALCFLGVLRYHNRAKVKKHLKTRGKRWAKGGLEWLRSSVALGACLGAGRGFRPGSPPTYENSPLPSLWCNRFLGLLAKIRFKGILRGFICVYRVWMWVWLVVAFVGLVWLLCA